MKYYMVEEENTVQNKEHNKVTDGGGNTVQNKWRKRVLYTMKYQTVEVTTLSKWSSKQKKAKDPVGFIKVEEKKVSH